MPAGQNLTSLEYEIHTLTIDTLVFSNWNGNDDNNDDRLIMVMYDNDDTFKVTRL